MKIAGHIIKQNIIVIVHDVSQWKLDIRRQQILSSYQQLIPVR
jgi:hypothetical protein